MSTTETNLLDKFRQIYEKQEHKRFISFAHEARLPILVFAICLVLGIYFCYRSIILVTASNTPKSNINQPAITKAQSKEDLNSNEKIYVDLTGAINKPQTYQVDKGTRLFQLIEKAGGLSSEADTAYVQRNYNFAVVLTDQQKVHIPSVYEIRDGLFTEQRQLVSLTGSTDKTNEDAISGVDISLISLNESSLETLKSLPGVGDVTAQRIIAGRPYEQIEDLTNKGIIKQSLYDKIVNRLDL